MLTRINDRIDSAVQTFKTNLLFSRTFLHEVCVSKNWEMVKNINIIWNKLLKVRSNFFNLDRIDLNYCA